ncbi:GNAT family N-acetyltransferase [Microlunatus capsulatus]|uniref:GNAT superfamily N-acetyltransferase n=1 Tax=Microlunatus capsulatus TaxID=99117 RepID=A0ABS4Z567_9ACTN|nr:GNAT family N-acetyltransferase [Microlunatus capsulatus]MBP2416197.1 GNAT superfamily N-acetyltransferase [Microlunatus capsulatus]
MDAAHLLAAYDAQLRTDAETAGALDVATLGPLLLATFAGGQGFITYRDLGGGGAAEVAALVAGALDHFRGLPSVEEVEWKARGHDHARGLPEALAAHGFVAGEPESVMLGRAALLAADVALPAGVALRRVRAEEDVRAASTAQDAALGEPVSARRAEDLLHRLAADDGVELWVAESGGRVVSAGRLEPVAGSDVAGLWGGATLPGWRGRGIYRALTAARARSALALGRTLLHSDSTELSRPILERAGLVRVTRTTPWTWRR